MKRPQIGILGGGQLARMLALAAYPLGVDVSVLATNRGEPAAQVCGSVLCGSPDNESDLTKFFANLGAVTFESEFVDTARVARVVPPTCQVFPALTVIGTIQDRLEQKRLLDRFKIATSPWLEIDSTSDLKRAAEKFPDGLVLKQRRFGYDGHGTFIVRNPARNLDPSLLQKSKSGFIAEKWIPFTRELATSFVRSISGEFLTLPMVESVQMDARCFSVRGPITHAAHKKMSTSFKRLMTELDYHGVLATEFFEVKKALLVNELAPRVHNSAHYSIEGLVCSQFEYHLRAGLGMPLPLVAAAGPGAWAMINLLGSSTTPPRLNWSTAGKLHWYGKSENRPGRKMGHITVLDKNSSEALKQALRWRKDFVL